MSRPISERPLHFQKCICFIYRLHSAIPRRYQRSNRSWPLYPPVWKPRGRGRRPPTRSTPPPMAGKPWFFITSLAPIITSVLTIIDFCAELSPFQLPCCHPTSPKRRSLLGVSNVQILIGESESLCPIFIRIGEWTSCEPSSSIASCRQLKSHYPRMASRLPCPISKPSIRFPLTSCPARERETRIYFENEIARERI